MLCMAGVTPEALDSSNDIAEAHDVGVIGSVLET